MRSTEKTVQRQEARGPSDTPSTKVKPLSLTNKAEMSNLFSTTSPRSGRQSTKDLYSSWSCPDCPKLPDKVPVSWMQEPLRELDSCLANPSSHSTALPG